MSNDIRYITLDSVARQMGRKIATIRRWRRNGLKCVKVGGVSCTTQEWLDEFACIDTPPRPSTRVPDRAAKFLEKIAAV